MTELPQFRGAAVLVEIAESGQTPDHVAVYASDDGPIVLAAGRGGDVAIPVLDGLEVTGDPETFRELGERSILVGIVSERFLPWASGYTRVQALYVVDGFHGLTGESGTINAAYTSIGEGYVRPTEHNHRHLVSDPDEGSRYFLFDAE